MTTPQRDYAPSGSYPPDPGIPAHGGMGNPAIRASDADRDKIVARLSEQYQAGRLTADEFDERSGKALSARTLGDLAGLMTDLPAGPGDPEPPGTAAKARPPAARRGVGLPAAGAGLAVLAVVALIALLSRTGHHGSSGGWGFIIPALIIARIFAGRRTHRRDRDRD